MCHGLNAANFITVRDVYDIRKIEFVKFRCSSLYYGDHKVRRVCVIIYMLQTLSPFVTFAIFVWYKWLHFVMVRRDPEWLHLIESARQWTRGWVPYSNLGKLTKQRIKSLYGTFLNSHISFLCDERGVIHINCDVTDLYKHTYINVNTYTTQGLLLLAAHASAENETWLIYTKRNIHPKKAVFFFGNTCGARSVEYIDSFI